MMAQATNDVPPSIVEDVNDADGIVITKDMQEEEARLQRESEKEAIATSNVSTSELEGSKSDRMNRLNHLLSQSSVYADFLQSRMTEQVKQTQAQQLASEKRKLAQEKKKNGKSPAKAAATPTTRRSGRGKVRKSAAAAATTSEEAPNGTRKRKATQTTSTKTSKSKLTGEDFVVDETMDADTTDTTTNNNDADDNNDDSDFRTLKDGTKVSLRQPKLFSGGVLKPYQLDGMDWMVALYENGLNGILADEMGLGKTVQCVAFICHMYAMKVRGPFLVVGPLSTLPNWYSEFQRFAPSLPVILYHGTPEERTLKRREMKVLDATHNSFPVVITSYEIIMRDRKFLAPLPWKYIIVDEGHRLKNLNCRLIKELKTYQSANRLLLSGTPLQNNLAELWSLLNFLLPNIFNDLDQFQRWFDFEGVEGAAGQQEIVEQEQQDSIVSKLHGILQPFLLRRLKTDVELSIPDKKEIVLYAPLTAMQKEMYTGLLNRTLLQKLRGDEDTTAAPKGPRRKEEDKKDYREVTDTEFFKNLESEEQEDELTDVATPAAVPKSIINIKMTNIVMQLRKCCNHPYLLEWPLDDSGVAISDERLVKTSGKMLILDQLLGRLKADGHKVLIFSQFTTVLDILQDYCNLREYDHCRIDGGVPFEERRESMKRYNEDPECFIFLLSTRAGGLGINLTGADTVVIYDSDWNPQADLQAQDRCHRIGQTRNVLVYRLISGGTIDQRILERAEAKRKLEKLVIHKGKFKGGQQSQDNRKLSPQELLELLNESSVEQIDAATSDQVMSDEILERVLDRSMGTITDVDGKFKIAKKASDSKLLQSMNKNA
eukprot:m.126208 g.126208  ORF g.126208 m.126208 type:complete len:828 (+) comp29187_c0_seq1:151-2634(+)